MAADPRAEPKWEGGQRMMRAAAPRAFANIAAGDQIATAARVILEGCARRAGQSRKEMSCSIIVKPALGIALAGLAIWAVQNFASTWRFSGAAVVLILGLWRVLKGLTILWGA